jgi:protein subunit release factor A
METLDHEKAREKFANYLANIGEIKEAKLSKSEDVKLLDQTRKEISEIKMRLGNIEKILAHILKQEKFEPQQNIHNEIRNFEEIVDVCMKLYTSYS